MRRRLALLAILGFVVALAPQPASAANASVGVSSNQFSPSSVTIDAGESVTWTWNGGTHNVHFLSAQPTGGDCDFRDSGSCTRTFPTAGTYSYVCQAHGGMQGTVTVNSVAPANQAPSAAFSVTTNGLSVNVNAAASSDPDGTIASYAWSWGDGTPAGSGEVESHSYAAAGTYTITLTVTDDDGATDAEAKSATVSAPNAEPHAAFTRSVTHLTVEVDASSSVDDGTIASYAWSWGDGTAPASGVTASHTYASAGTYTIQLTVTDDDGATDAASHQVTAVAPPAPPPNHEPFASFTATVSNQTVQVDASASADSDGSIRTYFWAWGDGATSPAGVTATHTYDRAGTHTIVLTVTDDDGATDAATRDVVIEQPPAVAAPPTAAFTLRADGRTVHADASSSRDPEGPLASYRWTWGDGGTSDGVTATHEYAVDGTYAVELTVRGADGDAATSEQTILIDTAPDATAAPVAGFRFTFAGRTLSATSTATDADGDIVLYSWSFGDGGDGLGQSTTHTYASRGTFTVTHEAHDARGQRASTSQQVTTPPNTPPLVDFTATFNAAVLLLDANAHDDAAVSRYAWSFGDGAVEESGDITSHLYTRNGTYEVVLTVTDDEGASSVARKNVTLAGGAPSQAQTSPAPTAGPSGDAVPGAGAALLVAAGAAVALAIRRRW